MSDIGYRKAKPTDTPIVQEQNGDYEVNERYELIDGIRYDFLSSPKVTHQIVAFELNKAIDRSCYPEGLILFAPMDVHFDDENVVQPDIIFICNENLHIIRDGWVKGVPDLLVEILSPSNGKHDLIRKKALYERFGVKEYWIVDPVHCMVSQYYIEDSSYLTPILYCDEDILLSKYQPCIRINLSDIFQPIERFREQ